MRLLIIRHGIAEEPNGKTDAERRLTAKGRRGMKRAGKALHKIIGGVDVLATSPLARAVETGDIIAGWLGDISPTAIAPLSPGKSPIALLHWIQKQPADATIALVGHEPGLSTFASWMLTGLQESFIELKKGGACLLEIEGEIRAGRAHLLWLLKPSQLRSLT